MALIKLVNKTRQTIRTSLYKAGVSDEDPITWVISPKSETISFDESLLTQLAKNQINRGFLIKVNIKC